MRNRHSSLNTVQLIALVIFVLSAACIWAEDPPRVFITDSNSWEVRANAGGSGGVWAAHSSGGARPQTAEIIKTFGERCPNVTVNNRQENADYIVVLDHEGGKGLLQHRNKVAVFNAVTGDSIVSKSTLSLGGSVQDACEAIARHWSEHSKDILAAKAKLKEPPPAQTPTVIASNAKLSISSSPDGADIDVDGSFAGNTPSTLELAPGEHTVTLTKPGFKAWSRKIKLGGGDVRLTAELDKLIQGQ